MSTRIFYRLREIFWFGREPGRSALIKLRGKTEVYITSITAFELLLGVSLSSKKEREG